MVNMFIIICALLLVAIGTVGILKASHILGKDCFVSIVGKEYLVCVKTKNMKVAYYKTKKSDIIKLLNDVLALYYNEGAGEVGEGNGENSIKISVNKRKNISVEIIGNGKKVKGVTTVTNIENVILDLENS